MKPCDTCLAVGTETCEGCTVKLTHVENVGLKEKLHILEEGYKEIYAALIELEERNEKVTLSHFNLTNEFCQMKHSFAPIIAKLKAALSMCSERFLEIEKYAKEQDFRDGQLLSLHYNIKHSVKPDKPLTQEQRRLQDEAAGIARQAHDMAEFCEKLTQVEIVED